MTHRFDRSVVLGLGLLVALLIGNTVVSYRNTRELNENARSVTHTHEVLEALNEVRDKANRAEAMQRNHVITDDDHFVPLFTDAIATARDQIGRVKRLTADNPTQQARVPALEAQLDAIERRLTRTAVVRKEQGFDAARQIVLTGESRKQIDDLRGQVEEMEREEHELLRDRQQKSDRAYAAAVTAELIAAGLGLAAVLGLVWLLDRHLTTRARAAAVVHAHKELLHATLASIGDGVIATDARGRVTFLNPVAQRLTGWAQGESHGEPLETVFRIVNEATRQPVENPALRALREGQIVGLANHTVLIARDGTERPIDDSAAPIRDGDSVTGAVLVFRDVTERRRLERQIAERGAAARLLASIVESSNDAVISKSLDGTIQSWNAAAERLFGYTAEQAVGRPITMLIPADRLDEEDRIIARLRAGERIEHFDTVRLRSDGRPVHVSLTISPVRDEAGRVVGASKLVRDVTDRKRAEEALRASEERYRTLFDSIDAGFCVIEVIFDERNKPVDYRFLVVNPSFEKQTGIKDAPGKTIREIAPNHEEHWFETYGKIALTGEPARFENRAEDLHRWYDVYAFRHGRPEQRQVGVLFSDVTPRKQAEARLRENEHRFRTLVEQVKDYAIFMTDPQGRATSWNEGVQRVLGYEEAEWLGQDIVPLIFTPEDIRDGVPQREVEQAATEGSASNDRWMMRKDGTRFFALGVTTALRDDDGRLLGFTKVMRDQTERHRLENELRQVAADLSEANHKKDEFLAMLAHELRNPLAPIRNAVEIVRRSDHDPTAVRRAYEMVGRQVNQMTRFVDDLLDVSRISRGKIELRTGPVELASVIHHAVEAARPLCENKGHELGVTLPPEPIHLTGDPARLAQVVGNLLSNAVKFTDPGGRIELTTTLEGDEAIIRVSDNGIGIPADQLSRIFEMFTQVDTSVERSQSGLGIGLTLVKNLVELHGGTVEVHSAGLGRGTEFTVRLPLMRSAEFGMRNEDPSAIPHSEFRTPHSRRVLVVDDNRDSAESLAVLLRLTGHEVHTAYDGEEAVVAAAVVRPDVIVLDIGLPKLNGHEAARRIRQQPGGKDVLLVALTGWGQDEDKARSIAAGFDAHLVKPLDPDALAKLLRGAKPSPA